MGVGWRNTLLGIKQSGHKAANLPLKCAEAKKTWIYASIPPYIFMA
jgi:hypothetical protein